MVRTLPILPALLLGATGVAAPAPAQEFACAGLEPPVSASSLSGKVTASVQSPTPHGGVHALVVFAKFRGESPAEATAPADADRLFDPDLPGSLTHFYDTMSSGQFRLTGTVLSRRYESRMSAAAYLEEVPGEGGQYDLFTREILEAVDDDIDFGQFDNDGPDGMPNSGDDDGFVGYIFINVLSAPRGFIIGGATGVAGLGAIDNREPAEMDDAAAGSGRIRISPTRMAGSLNREGEFALTVGSMAHEFAHAFMLPDLYDIEYTGPEDDSAGIGRWGLMGLGTPGWNGTDGPNPFSAWSLEQLGWIGTNNDRLVEVVGDATDLVLEDRFRGGSIYKVALQTPLQKGHRRNYLLFERRTRLGTYYDRSMPGEGVLVWHVNPPAAGNNDERAKLVDLVCADGLFTDAAFPAGKAVNGKLGMDNLDFWAHDRAYANNHAGNTGDATDPFDGARYHQLSLTTNPSTAPGDFVPPLLPGFPPASTNGMVACFLTS